VGGGGGWATAKTVTFMHPSVLSNDEFTFGAYTWIPIKSYFGRRRCRPIGVLQPCLRWSEHGYCQTLS